MKPHFGNYGLKMFVVAVGAMLLAQAASAVADEVTLGNDRQGLVQYRNGGRVYPNGTSMASGTWWPGNDDYYYRRSLIAFDLSPLKDGNGDPIYSNIDSLTLKITLSGSVSGGPDNFVAVYGVAQDMGDWDFSHSTDPNVGMVAREYDPTMLGYHQFPTAPTVENGEISLQISGTDLTALIDGWINGNNAGFVLVGYEPAVPDATNSVQTAYVFGSQELLIEYSVVPEPATMVVLGLGSVGLLWRRARRRRA